MCLTIARVIVDHSAEFWAAGGGKLGGSGGPAGPSEQISHGDRTSHRASSASEARPGGDGPEGQPMGQPAGQETRLEEADRSSATRVASWLQASDFSSGAGPEAGPLADLAVPNAREFFAQGPEGSLDEGYGLRRWDSEAIPSGTRCSSGADSEPVFLSRAVRSRSLPLASVSALSSPRMASASGSRKKVSFSGIEPEPDNPLSGSGSLTDAVAAMFSPGAEVSAFLDCGVREQSGAGEPVAQELQHLNAEEEQDQGTVFWLRGQPMPREASLSPESWQAFHQPGAASIGPIAASERRPAESAVSPQQHPGSTGEHPSSPRRPPRRGGSAASDIVSPDIEAGGAPVQSARRGSEQSGSSPALPPGTGTGSPAGSEPPARRTSSGSANSSRLAPHRDAAAVPRGGSEVPSRRSSSGLQSASLLRSATRQDMTAAPGSGSRRESEQGAAANSAGSSAVISASLEAAQPSRSSAQRPPLALPSKSAQEQAVSYQMASQSRSRRSSLADPSQQTLMVSYDLKDSGYQVGFFSWPSRFYSLQC